MKLDSETEKLAKRLIIDDKHFNEEEIFSDHFVDYDSFRLHNLIQTADKLEERIEKSVDESNEIKDSKPFINFGSLDNTHVFRISKERQYVFSNVKSIQLTPDDMAILPFDDIFFDVIFEHEGIKVFGIHVYFPIKREVSKMIFDKDDVFLIKYLIYKPEKGFSFGAMSFSLLTGAKIDEENKEMKSLSSFIGNFMTNMILFFSEPRVSITVVEHNNDRRERKGKSRIPLEIKSKVSHDLDTYFYRTYEAGQSGQKLEFAYWVRQHKRRLMHPRYKEKKIIVVKAFLKGDGLQPPQVHEVI